MTRRGWILFVLLSLLWGLPYLLIKIAVAELPVAVLVFARVFLGAAILMPLAVRGGQLGQMAPHWRPLLAFAALEFIIPWGLLSHAEVRLSSSTAGLLMASIPMLGIVLGLVIGRPEELGWKRIAGLLAGFGGVAVLAGPEVGGDAFAIFEVLLAATCYAAGAMVASLYLQKAPPLPATTVCLCIAAVVYLPAAVVTRPEHWPGAAAVSAVAGLALFCTALAFVWYFMLIREAGLGPALLITYVNPAVAVIAGALVLNEPVTANTFGAFVLILLGCMLATRRAERPIAAATGNASEASALAP